MISINNKLMKLNGYKTLQNSSMIDYKYKLEYQGCGGGLKSSEFRYGQVNVEIIGWDTNQIVLYGRHKDTGIWTNIVEALYKHPNYPYTYVKVFGGIIESTSSNSIFGYTYSTLGIAIKMKIDKSDNLHLSAYNTNVWRNTTYDVSQYDSFYIQTSIADCPYNMKDSHAQCEFINYVPTVDVVYDIKEYDTNYSLLSTTKSYTRKSCIFLNSYGITLLDEINDKLYNNLFVSSEYTINEILIMLTDSRESANYICEYLYNKGIISENVYNNFIMSRISERTINTEITSEDTIKLFFIEPVSIEPTLINDEFDEIYLVIISKDNYVNDKDTIDFLNGNTNNTIEQIVYSKFTVGDRDSTADIKLDYINRIDMIDKLEINLKLSNIIN